MARSTSETIEPTPKEERKGEHWDQLNEVIDPEIGIGVVDLGLIYQVKIKDGLATIHMTLTSPMCPVGPTLVMQVEDKMRMVPGVEQVYTEIVWDPPWTQDLIDPDLRMMLFGS